MRSSLPSTTVIAVTDRTRPPVAPVRPDEPIEWRMALRGVAVTVALGLVLVACAGWWLGAPGIVGAATAVTVVAGMQALSGGLLSLAAPFGPSALLAAALGGYLLKLCIYALLIVLLRDVDGIHGPSLAITAAILLVVALAWQTRLVMRDRRLFWVVDPTPDGAVGPADRVVYTTGREPSRGLVPRTTGGPAPPNEKHDCSTDPRSTERTSA